tara:strand:- start:3421 stop:3846 length:426 start_codon:yes stop_codon:yes gene_type:complete
MEKFKYGPLVWNSGGDNDDEGNYYWAGKPPVSYDSMKVPVDIDGRQCLPMDCPFHPHYSFSEKVISKIDPKVSYPSSFSDYQDWLDKNFIVFEEGTIKRDIIKKIIATTAKQYEGSEVSKKIRLIVAEIEAHYGKTFIEKE